MVNVGQTARTLIIRHVVALFGSSSTCYI